MHQHLEAGSGRGWHQIAGYDWTSVPVPPLDSDWQPTQRLSVVMPAYDCQEKLDLTLAALSVQTYPAELFEVLIVDDGSALPLRMPPVVPPNTRIIRLDRELEWGRARACHAGALDAQGEILLFLDADMLVYPDHLRAHARWHHVIAEAVTLGHKLFADFDDTTVQAVVDAARRNAMSDLVGDRPHQEHEWVERVIEDTKNLTVYHPVMFRAAVGATVGMRRALYAETGGFRVNLTAGEDMEMGYRLMAAGAVFIPEREARSWHQGPATFMSRADEVRRRVNPHFANYVPVPGRFRPRTPGRQYAVPMISIGVPGVAAEYDTIKRCVDSLLASEETDLRVEIFCASETEDFELLHAQYQDDPRVRLEPKYTETGYPSRFWFQVPPWAGLATGSVGAMLAMMEADELGLLRVALRTTSTSDESLLVWRTAALHRARRHETSDEPVEDVAGRLFGERTVDGAQFGIVDLREAPHNAAPSTRQLAARLSRRLARAEEKLGAVRDERHRLRAQNRRLRRRNSELRQTNDRLRARYQALRSRRIVRAVDALSGWLKALRR